ncbi:MAG: hypothetical protein QOI92_2231, partial [Chloroflexota bacterium]|nr:hypothetical protein [Chloroflexota bacterium]
MLRSPTSERVRSLAWLAFGVALALAACTNVTPTTTPIPTATPTPTDVAVACSSAPAGWTSVSGMAESRVG